MGGSSHQPNLFGSFETRQAILQFLSPPPGEFSANINAVLPLARAQIARRVRGRELEMLVALIGPHDNHGSALTAQPGRSHGRHSYVTRNDRGLIRSALARSRIALPLRRQHVSKLAARVPFGHSVRGRGESDGRVAFLDGPGGGKRGAARAGHGTALVGNRHAQCGDWAAFSFFLAS